MSKDDTIHFDDVRSSFVVKAVDEPLRIDRAHIPYFEWALAIARLRGQVQMTQGEFAAKVGTTQSAIARAESGRHGVTAALLNRIAAAFGRDVGIEFVDPSVVVPPVIYGPICGVVSASGPNGELLACAYPPNAPGQPMHEHSWATLPTFVTALRNEIAAARPPKYQWMATSEGDPRTDAELRHAFFDYIDTAAPAETNVLTTMGDLRAIARFLTGRRDG